MHINIFSESYKFWNTERIQVFTLNQDPTSSFGRNDALLCKSQHLHSIEFQSESDPLEQKNSDTVFSILRILLVHPVGRCDTDIKIPALKYSSIPMGSGLRRSGFNLSLILDPDLESRSGFRI